MKTEDVALSSVTTSETLEKKLACSEINDVTPAHGTVFLSNITDQSSTCCTLGYIVSFVNARTASPCRIYQVNPLPAVIIQNEDTAYKSS